MSEEHIEASSSFPAVDGQTIDGLRQQLATEIKRICPARLASVREDIVQAALIKVVRLAGRHGGKTFSTAYLRKVALSATVDEIRRHRRRAEQSHDDSPADQLSYSSPGPEEHAIGRQVREAIVEGLARLGGPRRQAVLLHLEGHTVPEAAHNLGWSSKRVANLTYRGLNDLRRRLAAQGFMA
jgi:RNA polymerase sigma-70 factor (ECF subfamily)